MRSFLVRNKTSTTNAYPTVKWGMLATNTYFEGDIPVNHSLAISPSKGYIIVDVDRHGKVDGFNNLPDNLLQELANTFSYPTKNNGRHFWFKYTGDKHLINKASNQGIDLRTNKGYVIFYPGKPDIRAYIDKISSTSIVMNDWLETLFS